MAIGKLRINPIIFTFQFLLSKINEFPIAKHIKNNMQEHMRKHGKISVHIFPQLICIYFSTLGL
jgi:hypothetical protein